MTIGRKILLAAAKSEFLAKQAPHRSFSKKAVKKCMPGEKPEDALDAAAVLGRNGEVVSGHDRDAPLQEHRRRGGVSGSRGTGGVHENPVRHEPGKAETGGNRDGAGE